MIQKELHDCFCRSNDKLSDWYCRQLNTVQFPIYSSYDIRDSGFKIANVDGNIYPAGFNNICNTDQDYAGEIFQRYVHNHYGKGVRKILLVPEEHTNNPYYWDNVIVIQKLLQDGGFTVKVAAAQNFATPWQLTSAKGHAITVGSAWPTQDDIRNFAPDLILSNNDFSDPHLEWWKAWSDSGLTQAINPPRELGWYQRKKSRYFHHYNELVTQFTSLIQEDPFLLSVRTQVAPLVMDDDAQMHRLAEQVETMLSELRQDYAKRKIDSEPFVFIKNNAGTYGLAVVRVGSAQEVLEWNYKSRKKMKAAKGGREVTEVILQEGVPSRIQSDGVTAEPVVYMIGSDLAGGFLRTHAEKNSTESLNSPGAIYKRLCVSDLNISIEGHPLENVYGWTARLGLLAMALEAKEMQVQFLGYKAAPNVESV